MDERCCILIHGLGQDSGAWEEVCQALGSGGWKTPDLFALAKGPGLDYPKLYRAFAACCDGCGGTLNLCGLSLGGLLALDYAKARPEKVASLVLIEVPHRIPKFLFALQGLMFRLMPASSFASLGTDKASFIGLVDSMRTLDILQGAGRVHCRTLLLCGVKDKPNRKSLAPLHQALPNSAVRLIPGAAHEINREAPQALAKVLRAFWAEM